MLPDLTQEELLRYSRHLLLPDIGLAGQRKLKGASVLVVGSGGLGSPIALYLAAAGIGRIGLVDYDVVDGSNLQRQVIHSRATVGRAKVESARERLVGLNEFICVDTYDALFSAENAAEIAASYDILVDGTDNFPTRYLLNDLAVFSGRPYVYGSVFRFEGQVSVFDARRGPCYRCLFAEPPPPGVSPACGEGGVFGVLPGIVGSLQAAEVLKLILGVGDPLIGQLMLCDVLDMSFQKVALRKDPGCKVCGEHPSVMQLMDYEAFCGVGVRGQVDAVPEMEWSPQELAEQMAGTEPPLLLDVRAEVERQVSEFSGAISIPLEQLRQRYVELDASRSVLVFCRTGTRSARAVQWLRQAGFERVYHLRGGINAWAEQVDATMRRY